MRQILMTTAIAGMLFAVPAFSQTTDTSTGSKVAITAPEGYQTSDLGTLTFEELQGASVYDSTGERVGEISDFVMSTGTNSTGTNTTGASTGTSTGTSSDMATTGTSTDSSGSSTASGTDTTGTATTGSDTSGSNTAATDSSTAGTGGSTNTSNAGGNTATSGSSDTTTAGTTATTTAGGSDSSTSAATGTGTGTGTDTTTAATGTDTTAAGSGTASNDANAGAMGDRKGSITGRVTHVVMDIGGFLGIGEHTVAVPVSSLQLFRGSSANDLRVYLPWTEDQLKALPEYKEGDVSTYGMDPNVTQ